MEWIEKKLRKDSLLLIDGKSERSSSSFNRLITFKRMKQFKRILNHHIRLSFSQDWHLFKENCGDGGTLF